MNNVLTYSHGSGLVYGTGRTDGVYTFYALDWATGNVVVEEPLGTDAAFTDGGNQVVVLSDRSVIYGSGAGGLIRVGPEDTAVGTAPRTQPEAPHLEVFPNPTRGLLNVRFSIDRPAHVRLTLQSLLGQEVMLLADRPFAPGEHTVDSMAEGVASGVYLVRLDVDGHIQVRRTIIVR